jgi:hypothetical protein
MITCKDSVRFSILRSEMWSTFDNVHAAFKRFNVEPMITCGTEAHGADDPHTNGFALDLRTKHIQDNATKHAIHEELKRLLGSIYTVIFENEDLAQEHFHIQVRKDLWRTML